MDSSWQFESDGSREDADDVSFDREALSAIPHDVLQNVFRKFARMTLTLREIEDWLDTREARPCAVSGPGSFGLPSRGPRRLPRLSLDNLDDTIQKEEEDGD
jgi:hypothetical protein